MRRVLVLSSVASMIDQFNKPNIKLLIEMGYEVHVVCNFIEGNTCSDEQIIILKNNLSELNVKFYQIDFKRNVMRFADNIKAYKQVHKLAIDNKYKFIHCHSPIGGVVGRLVGNQTNTKVIYTAHGFHFFKGAPLKNWLMYYPVEKWLSRYTAVLITINKEDYDRAKKSFKIGKVEYIPGVGIDTKKFSEVIVDKSAKRSELGLPQEAFIVLSVGELNKNKNHEVIIKAITKLNNPNVYYVICGQGVLEDYLKDLIRELGLDKQVKLLGYRRDIAEISKAADIFAFPSKREGLGLAALEAMASGLPIVTSNVHGIVDYSANNITGYTCSPMNDDGFAKAIEKLANNYELRIKMGQQSIEIVKNFDIKHSINKMTRIYIEVLQDE